LLRLFLSGYNFCSRNNLSDYYFLAMIFISEINYELIVSVESIKKLLMYKFLQPKNNNLIYCENKNYSPIILFGAIELIS